MLIAVDIALLPSERDMPLFLEWNARLLAEGDDTVRLAAGERAGFGLPHVSLSMGVLDEERAPVLAHALTPLARPLVIPTNGLASTPPPPRAVTSLGLAAEPELVRLHEAVLAVARPHYEMTEATADMFVERDLDNPPATTCDWVTSYDARSAEEHFDPHVTIGYGDARLLRDTTAPPESIELPVLGLFHLGASCTCRRVLWRSDR